MPAPTRRAFLAASTALGALGVLAGATPAAAQLDRLLGGARIGGIDLGRVASGVSNLFEGMALSEQDEITMGSQLYPRLIGRSGGVYPNRHAQEALRRFAAPLFATSRRPFKWEVVLLDDDTVNAWALPAGKLAVNKGLLRYVDDPAELAAVLAHEIGHAELSHVLAEMRNSRFTQGLTDIGKEVISQKLAQRGAGGALAREVIDQLEGPLHEMVTSGYSRTNEDEADRHILAVFAQSGHDTAKAADFFKTLLQLVPPNAAGTTSLFSTHPGTRERILALQSAARTPVSAPRAASEGYAELKAVFPTRRVFRRLAAR